MQLPTHFLDELRTRILPSELIGRHVSLKQKTRGEFVGCCPFHNEKTPSFTVSDDKGFYHCFGCSAHGDIVKFVMEKNGLPFMEAVTFLADMAGVTMPQLSKEEKQKQQRATTLYDVLETACLWFEENLRLSHAKVGLDYLKNRGLTDAHIATFRLGYAPDDYQGLRKALIAKGIDEALLLEAGLTLPSEKRENYDRFRGRIIFPITDVKGRVIAFGGRIIGEGQPKYLNSPETPVFKKGHVLYGFALARQAAFDKREVIASEGYMDVIALHKAGFTNAVAPLGTALTEGHLAQLWRLCPTPTICLDGDNAGQRAMARVAELAFPLLKPGFSLKFVTLPAGKDPDDVLKQEGTKTMKSLLKAATPLSEVIWNNTYLEHNPKTPEEKAQLDKSLGKLLNTITDDTVRDYYKNYFDNRLWRLKRSSGKEKTKATAHKGLGHAMRRNDNHIEAYLATLIAILLHHPELFSDYDIEEAFTHIDNTGSHLDTIRHSLIELLSADNDIKSDAVLSQMAQEHTAIDDVMQNPFLDSFAKATADKQFALLGWKITIARYNLVKAEEECTAHANNEDTLDTAWEMQKQVNLLKKIVENEENHYKDALED